MMWVSWRQHRAVLIGALAAVAAMVAFLVVSGLGMRATFERLGLDRCAAPLANTCPEAVSQFTRATMPGTRFVVPLLLLVPALIGVFWGAPLVARELEAGTHRVAWTQSISRRRWFVCQVGLLVGASTVVSVVVALAVNWWAAPIDAARPQQFEVGMFDSLGVAPLGACLLALGLGVAAGTFAKRLVPAIGLTLVLFLALRVGTVVLLRPHYLAPVQTTIAFPQGRGTDVVLPRLPSDIGWGISIETVDADGNHISDDVGIEEEAIATRCPELAAAPTTPAGAAAATASCIQRLGLRVEAVYQPADRFWVFQAVELAVDLVLAAGALGLALAWVQRRRA